MSKNEFYCDCTAIHEDVLESVKNTMLTKAEFDSVTKFFKAIGDNTRIKILWAIYNHEMCVCDLANLLSMTKSAISHQLRELRLAKLVKFNKIGKTVYYSLADEHVSSLIINALSHVKE